MRRFLFVLAAMVVPLWISGARAQQEASFDCFKAAAPIEHLICSDPELRKLDGSLGEIFASYRKGLPEKARGEALSRQRAWLADRLARCDVPAKGDEVALALRWRAAPCLDEMYRVRLIELGSPPPPMPAQPQAMAEPGFIHPLCLWNLVEGDPEEAEAREAVPLGACARGNLHIPVSPGDRGGYASEVSSGDFPAWMSYELIGKAADGREAVLIRYNTGGTGQFSEIYLLRRTPSKDGRDTLLSGEVVAGGGDRCNGGIEAAKLIDPRTLEIDYRITPQDLLSEADEALADQNMDALAFCAICCTGTLRSHFDLTTSKEASVSVTVNQLLSDADVGAADPDDTQACFDTVIGKAAGSLPHTFAMPALKDVARTFAKTCLKKP